jgi:subtilisin family serine protease
MELVMSQRLLAQRALFTVFGATLVSCAFDDPAQDLVTDTTSAPGDDLSPTLEAAAAPGALASALTRAMRDGMVSNSEWTNTLSPLAQQLPHTASSDANALVTLWADHPSAIAATAFEGMRTVLNNCGYGVPRSASEPALSSAVLIADNLTTPDTDFETVAAAAGVAASATITIAVLDDGILFSHPALASHKITQAGALTQFDFVDNDATLPATDHGTATASLAARGTPRVKILPLRIAVNSGIPATLAFGQVVSDAIDTAAQQGVTVVSISYVTNQPPDITQIRAAMARHPNTLFLLAAGNGNTQLGGPGLEPNNFLATMHTDNVMIVSNANRDNTRFQASFDGSNFGTPYADIAMRGMDIPLAISNGSYGRSRGTSSATPNTAAVAARMRLIKPQLTAAQVKALLLSTAKPVSDWTGLVNANGVVDPARAIRAAAGM